jgi:hypothetical protein
MQTNYKCLSGRRYDLDALGADERGFLESVFSLYRTRPAWDEFRSAWVRLGRERVWNNKVAVGSAPYRICQDLAARLGIAEGKVAPLDYRDLLADLIEERFGSRYAFCKETGIDQGHLSRVLAGKKHLAPTTLFEVLDSLGVQIDLVQPEDLFQRAADAPHSQLQRLGVLEHHVATLRTLLARADDCSPEERATLFQQVALLTNGLGQAALPAQEGDDVRQAVDQALARALDARARVAQEIATAAAEEREAHGRTAS